MRTLSICLPLVLVAPALAQQANLTIDQEQDAVLRFNITAELNVSQTTSRLLDGQEFTGRGGRGGGGGEVSITQAIVFDRGPASAGWREYLTLESTTDQGGQERQVQGALAGQRVFWRDGALYQSEAEDAQPVAANLSRGVPGRIALAGLMASGEISVGDEFDISETFLPAFRGLMHPVTPEGGQRGGGGRGGGRGGRGGRGRGGFGGGGDAVATLSQVLGSAELECAATGKLVSVEERDGTNYATAELTVELKGEGTAEELGMGGRGRGGRGGRGGGDAGTSKGTASIQLEGSATVNLGTRQLHTLELNGQVDLNSDVTRSTGRGSFQTIQGTKGTFKINVTCEPVSG